MTRWNNEIVLLKVHEVGRFCRLCQEFDEVFAGEDSTCFPKPTTSSKSRRGKKTVTICRAMIKTKLERQIHGQERNLSGCLSSRNDDLPLGSEWLLKFFSLRLHSITISLDIAVDFLRTCLLLFRWHNYSDWEMSRERWLWVSEKPFSFRSFLFSRSSDDRWQKENKKFTVLMIEMMR
jgi:hypothetical protein